MISASINADDFRSTMAVLKGLPKTMQKSVLKKAVGKLLTPLLRDIRKIVKAEHFVSGAMYRSFGRRTFMQGDMPVVIAGVRNKWVDPKSHKTPNKYAGRVEKRHPFIAPTVLAHQQRISDDFTKEVNAALAKVRAKHGSS